jgi:peptide chain release factor 1
VPPTERKGRVHTSTVTVSITNPQDKKEIVWNEKDFKIEWYSGTGKGGSNRNKKQCSCRIIHLETGIIATSQTRSRENSFKDAKDAILKKINEHVDNNFSKIAADIKRNQVGSGMRGDKVRTFMEQHGIVKDHRTNKQASFDLIMNGNFNLLWD